MGNTSDFTIENGILTAYNGPGGVVIIPEGVISIGNWSFGRCKELLEIIIPDGVTCIGRGAFELCENMKNVTIPETVTSIGRSAFSCCRSLTKVTIPISVTDFGDEAFAYCNNLTDAIIREGVTSIGGSAFKGCSSLTNIKIPESVANIGDSAFSNCSSLMSVSIPNRMTKIGYSVFSGCISLTSVTIPDHIEIIGCSAFQGCSNLTKLTIPESVTEISLSAFNNCYRLSDITLSRNLASIGNSAFSGCYGLSCVTIPDSVTTIEEEAFHTETKILIEDISRLPASLRPNAAVGFAVNNGGKGVPGFDSHSKYIKANAAKLLDTAMAEPALLAMMCRESLITPKNLELYMEAVQKSQDTVLIAMMLDYQKNKISDKQKESAEKRKENKHNMIVDRAMARQGKVGIEGLNIAVTGELETFENRSELRSFILEKKGKLASSLTAKIDYLIMNDPDSNSTKAKSAQELGIEIITERRFNEIAGRIFIIDGNKLMKYCGEGGNVIIPCEIMVIGDWAFSHCKDLISITVPRGVTRIGIQAFSECKNLQSVFIPGSVKDIHQYAAYNSPNIVVHAPAGSYAEQYAKENNIPFVAE